MSATLKTEWTNAVKSTTKFTLAERERERRSKKEICSSAELNRNSIAKIHKYIRARKRYTLCFSSLYTFPCKQLNWIYIQISRTILSRVGSLTFFYGGIGFSQSFRVNLFLVFQTIFRSTSLFLPVTALAHCIGKNRNASIYQMMDARSFKHKNIIINTMTFYNGRNWWWMKDCKPF